MNKSRSPRFMPFFLALSMVAGILIGTFYANHFSGNRLNIINTSNNKLNDLLRIIDEQYVDTIDMATVIEDAMPKILSESTFSIHQCSECRRIHGRPERKLLWNWCHVHHKGRYYSHYGGS